MSFKEMVEQDNRDVFLNTEEFAERRNVKYDGITYEHIPVLLSKIRESQFNVSGNNMEGIHRATELARFNLKDLGGVFPEQNTRISISDHLVPTFFTEYKIVTSSEEVGMVVLELEAFVE